jgi:UDP-N-acetylmuramoyl-tripeptide--D-alanyl-D-alanine ligase
MIRVLKTMKHSGRRLAAKMWLNTFSDRVVQVAVTGSYGKTSVTYAVFRIISDTRSAIMTDLNLDTRYNVPITALKLRREEFIIFELGIDHLGEMDFHLEIVNPHISVITGITSVHSDDEHLKSVENIIKEKRRVIEVLKPGDYAVLNRDDPYVRTMAEHTKATVIWYGSTPDCDVRVYDVQCSLHGLTFRVAGRNAEYRMTSSLLGRHNASNLAAAVAVAEIVGIDACEIEQAIARISPLSGRLNVESGPHGLILANDSLRANPASTKAGLDFIGELDIPGNKLAVIGEMGELGDSAVEDHEMIGKAAYDAGLDLLICIGDLTRHTARTAQTAGMRSERVYSVQTPQEAVQILQAYVQEGSLLYLKASLLRHIERVSMLLEGQSVGCTVSSCHFYHPCRECPYLVTGMQ